MSEEFAERMDKAMRKGFISTMILTILENKPSYGYRIGKEIEERTESLWEPPASTMYTILNQLKKKGFIKVKKELKNERGKKIYEISDKGKKTLELIWNKHKRMRNIIHKFVLSTIGQDDIIMLKDLPNIDPFDMVLNKGEDLSKREEIQFLEAKKERILGLKKLIDSQSNKIDKAISKLNNEQNRG